MKHFFLFPQKTIFTFFALLTLSIGFFVSAETSFVETKSLFHDADQDGLSDQEEKVLGTNHLEKDTDQDGYSDGVEVRSGYDPMKAAPGDKLITSLDNLGRGGYDASADTINLTESASNQVVSVLSRAASDTSGDATEDIGASLEKLLSEASIEVSLPEIDLKTIKIRSVTCKHLDSEECTQKKKDATVKYLTALAYLIANNSPTTLKVSSDLELAASSLLTDMTTALSTGNFSVFQNNRAKTETFLKNVQTIEVPENMLTIHVKALQLALFSQNLGDAFVKTAGDPISQISLLSQAQGMMSAAIGLSADIDSEFKKLGIEVIPVDL